jgi:uncharacterized protein YndB with AHSA1/START domain
MTVDATDTSVRVEIVVEAPIEHAFRVFTEEIGSWWPAGHHILDGDDVDLVFEPREGGHVYDLAADGSECRWARVLAYEPPRRVLLGWDIDTQWQLETDLERTSEVEVTFHSLGDERTRVVLEHRNLDRHGGGWEGKLDAVGSSDGWPGILRAFAERLNPGSRISPAGG